MLTLWVIQPALAQMTAEFCGPIPNPWDYNVNKNFIYLVEHAHFTRQVENLIRGESTSSAGPDLDYTLGRFPNHPRALISVTRAAERKLEAKIGLPRPVECYFERALRFRKDDRVARMLYAQFLYGQNRKNEALEQLKITSHSAGDNPMSHRNIGLIYLEMKEPALALEEARLLERLNYDDPILNDALKRAGVVREPATGAAASAAADAASAASAASK